MISKKSSPSKNFAFSLQVIFVLCDRYRLDFRETYALVGLWNSFFLVLFSFFGVSKVMKWSTRFEKENFQTKKEKNFPFLRSTEEIFALFVSIAFLVDASTHVYRSKANETQKETSNRFAVFFSLFRDFLKNYSTDVCKQYDDYWKISQINRTNCLNNTVEILKERCARDTSLLYILLALGTVWFGTFLYKFKQTPYLTSARRELLTDYALPVSVIVMSLIGSLLFRQINRESMKTTEFKQNKNHFSPFFQTKFNRFRWNTKIFSFWWNFDPSVGIKSWRRVFSDFLFRCWCFSFVIRPSRSEIRNSFLLDVFFLRIRISPALSSILQRTSLSFFRFSLGEKQFFLWFRSDWKKAKHFTLTFSSSPFLTAGCRCSV